MRRVLIPVLLASLGFASPVYAIAPPAAAVEAINPFTVTGIKVDANAPSPRAARDLAMTQGRALAWSKLVRCFAVQGAAGSQPLLPDNQLLGLILKIDVGNERRSTTRYLADVTFHFNPAAVRQLLSASTIAFTDAPSNLALAIPPTEPTLELSAPARLTVDVRFDTLKDWAVLRARLGAVKTVTGMNIVGFALHEAQIDLAYLGPMEQLKDALARQNLGLNDSAGQYTLEFGTATATTAANLP